MNTPNHAQELTVNIDFTSCNCKGYDATDPCGHGDTSEGCPVHDPNLADVRKVAAAWEALEGLHASSEDRLIEALTVLSLPVKVPHLMIEEFYNLECSGADAAELVEWIQETWAD